MRWDHVFTVLVSLLWVTTGCQPSATAPGMGSGASSVAPSALPVPPSSASGAQAALPGQPGPWTDVNQQTLGFATGMQQALSRYQREQQAAAGAPSPYDQTIATPTPSAPAQGGAAREMSPQGGVQSQAAGMPPAQFNATGQNPGVIPNQTVVFRGQTPPAADPAIPSFQITVNGSALEPAAPVATGTTVLQTQAILDRIAASDQSALAKAMDAVNVRLSDPDAAIQRRFLDPLPQADRERLVMYEKLLKETREQMLKPGASMDTAVVQDKIAAIFGGLPLEVKRFELCRRVEGYGIFTPLDAGGFVAGRAQPVLLYVELERFHAEPIGGDKFEVRLKQEAELFDSQTGVAVWRQEPVTVVDQSKNRRRDFFLVQRVTLPAHLAPGEYVLKVSGVDVHGGMVYAKRKDVVYQVAEALAGNARIGR